MHADSWFDGQHEETPMTPGHMKWWTDARFGMFVHWGLPTLLERGF
jgi:hypothetical protein